MEPFKFCGPEKDRFKGVNRRFDTFISFWVQLS